MTKTNKCLPLCEVKVLAKYFAAEKNIYFSFSKGMNLTEGYYTDFVKMNGTQ